MFLAVVVVIVLVSYSCGFCSSVVGAFVAAAIATAVTAVVGAAVDVTVIVVTVGVISSTFVDEDVFFVEVVVLYLVHRNDAGGPHEVDPVVHVADTGGVGDFILRNLEQQEQR